MTIPTKAAERAAERPWNLTGNRYSPNLRKWVRKENARFRGDLQQVWSDKDGILWLGWIDDGVCFIGQRLGTILGGSTKAECGCWTFPVSDLTPDPKFWAEYARIGRCAIDTAHSTYFIGGETRWEVVGDTRECLWCGEHRQKLRKWTETVERERWEPAS